MMDISGITRFEYEDVFRAIGYFIDQNNIKEVCVVDLKEGLLVRGMRLTSEHSGYQMISETFLFTNEDLEQIVEDAYKRRTSNKGNLFRLKSQAEQTHDNR